MERLSKQEFRCAVTWVYMLRSNCDRLHTATTLWTPDPENRLLAGGYNGAPSGHPSCDEIGHLMIDGHCLRASHGELNAIRQCRDHDNLKNGTATIIGSPCYSCARELIGSGVRLIEYIGVYHNAPTQKLLDVLQEELVKLFSRANVRCVQISPSDLLETIQKALLFSCNKPGGIFKDYDALLVTP